LQSEFGTSEYHELLMPCF